jgi:hypothetical protein
MYGLIVKGERGELDPLDVALGPLENPTRDMITLAAKVKLWMGLRVAVCDDRPLPLSLSFVCEQMGWDHESRASRALNGLVNVGYMARDEPLKGRRGRRGTHTFKPPERCRPLSAYTGGAVESDPVGVEAPTVGVEPPPELAQEAVVDATEGQGVADMTGARPTTTGDRAGRKDQSGIVVHGTDPTDTTGADGIAWSVP